jgi:putative transposase
MARPLRIEYEGAFYHVTARGNEGKEIFDTKKDYERFKYYLMGAQDKYDFLLHSYVLMTNHYHLIIETLKANLNKIMHYINGSYTTYFNRNQGRNGHLFQGRYKAILVDVDRYLLELSRYLHLNPVRAGLVKRPEEYGYSSYRSYITRGKEEMVHRDRIWGMISGDGKRGVQRYRRFVEEGLGKDLESPLKRVYGGVILGRDRFIRDILRKMEGKDIQRQDISYRRQLGMSRGVEEILDTICSYFKVTRDIIKEDRRVFRNIAIYFIKKYTGLTNREIGSFFGGISYSGITRVYQRFGEKVLEHRDLKKQIEEIGNILSNVKG